MAKVYHWYIICQWLFFPLTPPKCSARVPVANWRVPTPAFYAPLLRLFATLANVSRSFERVFPSGNLWSLNNRKPRTTLSISGYFLFPLIPPGTHFPYRFELFSIHPCHPTERFAAIQARINHVGSYGTVVIRFQRIL